MGGLRMWQTIDAIHHDWGDLADQNSIGGGIRPA
jgi:hypothetical protein